MKRIIRRPVVMTPEDVEERSREVAEALKGTADDLQAHARAEEINDLRFCEALDEQVKCCEGCGWWFDSEEITDGNCGECQ
jgi:hypothetical protein